MLGNFFFFRKFSALFSQLSNTSINQLSLRIPQQSISKGRKAVTSWAIHREAFPAPLLPSGLLCPLNNTEESQGDLPLSMATGQSGKRWFPKQAL